MPYKNLYPVFLFFCLVLAGCKPVSSDVTHLKQKKVERQQVYVIKQVNVIPMTPAGGVIEKATVIIENGKIISLNGPVPDHAQVINGQGKWLIPGLIDMHVHIPTDGHFNTTFPTRAAAVFTSTQDIMTPFVANGVTTVFELIAKAGHFGQRNEITRGDVIGPRMALAAMIDGGEESGRIANTPADGRQAVRMAKAEGYEFIKVYSHLDKETYKAIVDEAHKQGLKVAGHIPTIFRGSLKEAFIQHFGLVAHAEEFSKQTEDYSENDAQLFAQMAKENGTWLIPTLIAIESIADQARSLDSIRHLPSLQYVHPLLQSKWLVANKNNQGTSPQRIARLEKIIDFNTRLVKAFSQAGVPIVAGTDAGSSGVVWGFSLYDELALLVKAGLTPQEALASATRLPALWLGIDHIVGTIESGKYADLILLNDNPLTDIKNTRQINGVFVNGLWLSKSKITDMLSDLSKRNNAAKQKYDWNKRSEY